MDYRCCGWNIDKKKGSDITWPTYPLSKTQLCHLVAGEYKREHDLSLQRTGDMDQTDSTTQCSFESGEENYNFYGGLKLIFGHNSFVG